MEQKAYQIDHHDEPLLILPLCVGALLLSGEFFDWLSGLGDMAAEEIAAFRILYWGGFLCLGGLAAWRLLNTVHLSPAGLEYRFLGKTQKLIPWSSFSRAVRAHLHKADCIYLIPVDCCEFPKDRSAQLQFIKRNYAELTHFTVTKNNLRAVKAYLPGLEKERLHIWSPDDSE